MNVYIERVSNEDLPNLLEFASELISEMDRLKKETPSELKDSNKKLVAALKTQKRKLLSDTIKEIRRSGLKTSLTSNILATQKSINLILANSVSFDNSMISNCDPYFSEYWTCYQD